MCIVPVLEVVSTGLPWDQSYVGGCSLSLFPFQGLVPPLPERFSSFPLIQPVFVVLGYASLQHICYCSSSLFLFKTFSLLQRFFICWLQSSSFQYIQGVVSQKKSDERKKILCKIMGPNFSMDMTLASDPAYSSRSFNSFPSPHIISSWS